MNKIDDKNRALLERYSITVYDSYRFRGATFATTPYGLLKLRAYDGTEGRQRFEAALKNHISENGFKNIDVSIMTTENTFLCQNQYGENFVLCCWFDGDEPSIQDSSQLYLLAENLAKLHKSMRGFDNSEFDVSRYIQTPLPEILDRRSKEMYRVRNYIKGKRQRNPFESLYMLCCKDFFDEAEDARELLRSFDYTAFLSTAIANRELYHGSYTHHSVLFGGSSAFTFNFDKAEYGLHINDLYTLVRKAMEKNNWDKELGFNLINKYNSVSPLTSDGMKTLYVMLRYPEKFWKITNYYINSKKSWIPGRNLQKLNDIIDQRVNREEFLRALHESSF